MNNEKLEEFFSTPKQDDYTNMDYDELLDNIHKGIDLSKPKVYISDTDKFFIGIQNVMKKSAQSTKWNVNIEPKFHNKKIEGFFISFNKKY